MNLEPITKDWLCSRKQLGRIKDTWGATFMIYSIKTKFLIKMTSRDCMIFVLQDYHMQGIWRESILLGKVVSQGDVEELFTAITRGKVLTEKNILNRLTPPNK